MTERKTTRVWLKDKDNSDTNTHLLCHFVDNRCKVGGSIQLHCPQTLKISLQNPLYAHTVWTLTVTTLKQTVSSPLMKHSALLYIQIQTGFLSQPHYCKENILSAQYKHKIKMTTFYTQKCPFKIKVLLKTLPCNTQKQNN